MGDLKAPLPVKPFVGMLSPEADLFLQCAVILADEYGPLDMESKTEPWPFSDYYRDEMGSSLFRKFIFFRDVAPPEVLPRLKHFTTALEKRFSLDSPSGARRRINIDPGYVTEAKVILATTKDYAHRLYIGEHVYAEVTLRYDSRLNTFAALEHTYFDFRTEDYLRLFNKARDGLRQQLGRKPG